MTTSTQSYLDALEQSRVYVWNEPYIEGPRRSVKLPPDVADKLTGILAAIAAQHTLPDGSYYSLQAAIRECELEQEVLYAFTVTWQEDPEVAA